MPYIADADKSLNTTHISADYTNYEAARNAFFVLTVPETELENLIRPDYTGDPAAVQATDMLNAPTASQSLRLNVTKCPVPHFSVETGEYRRGNDVVKFATVPTWNDGAIEVDDIVGLDTKAILMSWLYLAYNPNSRMGGRMKDYKKTAYLTEYTQDYEPIRQWTLEGIFLKGLSESEFDRENDGKRKITADFVYDRAIVDYKF
jgi:hypothetical protein